MLVTAGGKTLTATDTVTAAIIGHIAGIKVIAATPNHFKVAGPTSSTAGQAFTATVTAQDAFGNTVLTYVGTIHWSSSDAQAALPADYTFSTAEKGVHKFYLALTLKTACPQTITATDQTTASAGTAAVNVAPARRPRSSSPRPPRSARALPSPSPSRPWMPITT